ncbi:MAG: pantetheine-phosphate adenylyltransferase [Oscillospiraceae bacterium]|nr:pantetheine-phosphate adenylyltransferase [Oscillospiraceae bacterium]
MNKTAVCPGSFDPVTNGHLDIIRRASTLFDHVIVLVVINPDKKPAFSPEERVDMLRRATAGMPNVSVDSYTGLLMDYVREKSACAVVKGLRAMSDFEYEFQMALTNKTLLPYAETVFLTTSSQNMFISYRLVKQLACFGVDISQFVPKILLEQIWSRLGPVQTSADASESSKEDQE